MTDAPALRLVFAGTPAFARVHLEALLSQQSHHVVAVYSQPDRPAGRGRKLIASPVKQLALDHGVPVFQPDSLRDPLAQAELAALQPDLMIVVAYGLILPQAVLDIPSLGCVNVHASLLPRWRGAAPIQRAIEAGDTETGIAIMQMDAGLDTGPVLIERRLVIAGHETGGSLHDRLAELGPSALVEALDLLARRQAQPLPQPTTGASYAAKISKAETRIDWAQPAAAIARKIRAFTPTPAAWSALENERVKLFDAVAIEAGGEPATILAARPEGLDIACGSGAVRVPRLQLEGGRILAMAEILKARSAQFSPGRRFQ